MRRALLKLNEWMTEEQAERVIFNMEHVDATGMARNRAAHEYLTYGMPMDVDEPRRAKVRAASDSSTSTIPTAASTSSSSRPSSASAAATSGATSTTTNAWSFPILSSS